MVACEAVGFSVPVAAHPARLPSRGASQGLSQRPSQLDLPAADAPGASSALPSSSHAGGRY
eukprot:13484970-Alexandrium_andersonii.AAC.1